MHPIAENTRDYVKHRRRVSTTAGILSTGLKPE